MKLKMSMILTLRNIVKNLKGIGKVFFFFVLMFAKKNSKDDKTID